MLARSTHSIMVNRPSRHETPVAAARIRDAATSVSRYGGADPVDVTGSRPAGGAAMHALPRSIRMGDWHGSGDTALGQPSTSWTSGGISCGVALRIHFVRNANLVWTAPARAAVAVPA